ncbi:reprolysin-like metallopeptidase [Chryseobacterium sp.]|uniref:reprolysin-like metallopeptidase n=1 Tax=Chryseobacterium sp. TaxID=1871047 RepID=UPI00289762DC|nr:zinc-dependent metalloprotease family protein [Chryseobacterium sp.]
MKLKFILYLCLLASTSVFAQQNYWSKQSEARVTKENLSQRWTTPKSFSLYQLDLDKLKKDLATAPQRFSNNESLVIKFPDSDGNVRNYIVQEASVMEPELQNKFPDIRSYTGWDKSNPLNTIRFSVTPSTGINIMYFDGNEVSYLDPYKKDLSSFILYKRKDLPKNDRLFDCEVESEVDNLKTDTSKKAPLVADGQFRTYRLALSATGEYTAFHGGTVALAMSAMATSMTRVNGIYEKTISATMVMVANNSLLVYTNSGTDPFTNGDPSAMITQNQANTNTVIGSANYDIGHVFGTNSGGLAGLGVVCISGNKARGVTGSGAPVGDPFDIDYVAHEIGHQFGAGHTFRAATGACSGNASTATAYEPGSGTTIMAYAGICGINNIQANSDPYFHAASVVQMNAVIMRSTDCAAKVSNNNGVPTANAGLDYFIPRGTAFVLTGVGTDPNNDPITYLWEQYDNQTSTQPPVNTSTVGPVYRSFAPTISTMRYFPNMTSILANNLTPPWEVTPNVARTLNFSLLVNDNKATGNQAANDAMIINVTNDGPFTVTSQTSNTANNSTTPMTVTWNVAGTNAGQINTPTVTIVLSKDAGLNFDTILASGVPNNGTATVTLPNENISAARLMVKAEGNIYFAINASNFSVVNTLSTTETKIKNYSIYPNPASDVINVSLKNNSQKADYQLFDASGRLVLQDAFTGETKIDVRSLSNGNYVLSLVFDNGEKNSGKFIIKK